MKRKLGIVLTVLLVVAIAALSLVGCKDKQQPASPLTVTINWNLDGVQDTVVELNASGSVDVTNLQLPTNEGFHVEGFYLDADCTQPVDLGALAASQSLTVYAKWAEDQAGQPAVLIGLQLRYLGGDKHIGESVNASEVEVIAQFSDGNVLRIREGFVVGALDSATAGEKTVEVSYTLEGVTVRSTITVNVIEDQQPPVDPEQPQGHTHDLQHIDRVAPTATEDGTEEYWYCDDCGKYFKDAEATLEIEDFDEWLFGEGNLPATGGGDNPPQGHTHSMSLMARQEPTATEDGHLEYWVCSGCDKAFEDEAGTREIADLDAWLQGAGKLPATGSGDNPPQGTYDVYFFNADDWQEVFAHVWENEGAALNEWPGDAMNALPDHEGWYKATFTLNGNRIIFNAGVGAAQSGTEEIDLQRLFFKSGEWYATMADADATEPVGPQDPDMLTIIVLDEFGWNALNVHYWNNEGVASEWPGVALEPLADKDGWYSAQVDARATQLQFNNGVGINEGGAQSNEFALDADNLYFWRGAWHNVFPEEPDSITLFYFNEGGWDEVYAYAWAGDATDGSLVEYLGEWAGSPMTAVEGHEGWFSIEVSVNATKVVFNNNDNGQTDNLDIGRNHYYANQIWNADFVEPEEELEIRLNIPGDIFDTYFYLNDETGEYEAEAELNAGVAVTITDNRGNTYSNWEDGCNFSGTAPQPGLYTFYLKVNDNNLIWVEYQPSVETLEVKVVVDGKSTFMVPDESVDYEQYKAMSINIFDGEEAVVYLVEDDDETVIPFARGNAPDGEGTYDFFYKVEDNLVYTYKHQDGPQDPEQHLYLVIVGEDQYELIPDEGAPALQYKKMDVEVNFGDAVSVTADGEVIPFAEGHTPDGAGTYDFYYVPAEELVYIYKHPGEPEQHEYLVTVGGNSYAMELDDSAAVSQYKKMDVEINFGDIAMVSVDGVPVAYADGQAPDGEGIYDFYLNCGENLVYTYKHPQIELTTIYFHNVDDWAAVYAYAWSGNDDDGVVEYLGEWGGKAMTAVEDHEGWFSIEVSVKATSIIMHNNLNAQTDDLGINPDARYFDGSEWKVEFPQVEPQPEENVTLYFHNDDEWETVYAYAWNGDPADGSLEEFLGKWCGTEMEPVQDHDGWFSIQVSVNAQIILFCNGIDGEGSAQTDDLLISARTPYYDWKDKAWSATFVEHEPEEPQEPQEWDGTITVSITWQYFGDADAFLWVWYADGTNNAEAFPGVKMAYDEEEGIWIGSIDPDKQFAGLIVARVNPTNGEVWNKSGNVTEIANDHHVTIAEMQAA